MTGFSASRLLSEAYLGLVKPMQSKKKSEVRRGLEVRRVTGQQIPHRSIHTAEQSTYERT